MPRSVEIAPGYVVEFPDSMSDAQVNSASARLFSEAKAKGSTPPSAATSGMIAPSTTTSPPATGTLMDLIPQQEQRHRDMEQMVDGLGAAIPVPTQAIGAVKAAVYPSKAAIAGKFQSIMSAAGDVPIDISAPGNAALRIMELGERGGTVPKAVRDFVRRVTDPEKGPMAYREARDFASNISRLSADEFNRLTPVLRKELGTLRVTLGGALTRAAATVGKGEEYTSAMRQYARRANVEKTAEKAWQGVKRGAGWAGIAGAGAYLGKKVSDLVGGD